LIILATCFPFVIQKEDLKKLASWKFLIWGLFFAILSGQLWFQGHIESDWVILQKILLSGGLVLLYLPIRDINKLNQAIIFSSLAVILFTLVKIPILVHKGVAFNFLEAGFIIEALMVDRVYLGLLSVLSILASYYFLRKEYDPANKYHLANIVLNVLFVLLLLSRIAIIVLVLVFVLSLFYKKRRGPQLLFSLGTIVLIVFIIFLLNNDLRKQFFYNNSDYQKEGLVANTLALEPRAVIWECAFKLASNDGVATKGLGFTNTNAQMMLCYENEIDGPKKKNWFIHQKYNIHNQFLDLYVATGVVVLAIFLAGLLLVFVRNRKEFYPTAALITLMMFLLIENMFHRQIGAYYVGYILVILLFSNLTLPEKDRLEQ